MFEAASDTTAPKVHLLGLLTSDISSLSNLVIPNVDIRFELKRNIPQVSKQQQQQQTKCKKQKKYKKYKKSQIEKVELFYSLFTYNKIKQAKKLTFFSPTHFRSFWLEENQNQLMLLMLWGQNATILNYTMYSFYCEDLFCLMLFLDSTKPF